MVAQLATNILVWHFMKWLSYYSNCNSLFHTLLITLSTHITRDAWYSTLVGPCDQVAPRLPFHHTRIHMHTRTHTHAHTHTHTHLYLYLYYHCQGWLRGPHSGGEPAGGSKTGGLVGSGDTSLISPVACPPQCSRGTHLWACKTHEMREVGYGLVWRHQNIRPWLLAI